MHMNNRDGIHQRRYLLGDIYCGVCMCMKWCRLCAGDIRIGVCVCCREVRCCGGDRSDGE